ncbi:carbohydrate ABC transporter permease [Cohnella soli]|uniref:Carbohydrate ABC transporter permease n=1 Tax=Cohnella soli TaxID=425005 RepID=A0ABW0I4P1_9BACL
MRKAIVYGLLIFCSLLFIAPLFWALTTALKSQTELYLFPPKWFPSVWKFGNFAEAWSVQPFNLFLKNTVIVTALATFGQVLSCALVAYGFARFVFKGRDFLFLVVLATMMIPWEVTMIPQYMEFNYLGWINTLKPLIVPSFFGSAYFIFLLRQFIMTIPREMDEAATIDGASKLGIFVRIIVPLMGPSLILVAVFQMLSCWNDYLGPLIFLNDQSKYTLTLGLSQFKGMYGVDMQSIMAITCLISIPPLAVFFFAQRFIVGGLAGTGIKG